MRILKDRRGEQDYNNQGCKMKIIKYNNANDITVQFESGYVTNTKYINFKMGTIKDPYHKSVYNNGYIGCGKYNTRGYGSKHNRIYVTWTSMLQICYSDKYQERQTAYRGCTVCIEWLNFQNFAKWYEENYYEIPGEIMELDKDILYKDNKIYSPDTCCFVPQSINLLFVRRNKSKEGYPPGITYQNDKYIIDCSLFNNEYYKIESHNTLFDAFDSYKKFKEKAIKDVADKYKSQIPKKLYNAMYEYKVEITD